VSVAERVRGVPTAKPDVARNEEKAKERCIELGVFAAL